MKGVINMTEKNQVVPTLLPATAQDVTAKSLLLEIRNAEILLGFKKKKDYSVSDLLKSFQVGFEVFDENDEKEKILPLVDAKNILLRYQIDIMVAKNNGYFDLKGHIPFENICRACHGTGELYRFYKNSTEIPCKFCSGKQSIKMIPCKNCKGSGQEKTPDGDGFIDAVCPACKGTGKIVLKCRSCRGTGVFHKMPLDSIKGSNTCKKCSGLGFIIPKPVKKTPVKKKYVHVPDNPVITSQLAQQIKGSTVEK